MCGSCPGILKFRTQLFPKVGNRFDEPTGRSQAPDKNNNSQVPRGFKAVVVLILRGATSSFSAGRFRALLSPEWELGWWIAVLGSKSWELR